MVTFILELPKEVGSPETPQREFFEDLHEVKVRCRNENRFMLVAGDLCVALSTVHDIVERDSTIVLYGRDAEKKRFTSPVDLNEDIIVRSSDSLLCVQPIEYNYLSRYEENIIRIFPLKMVEEAGDIIIKLERQYSWSPSIHRIIDDAIDSLKKRIFFGNSICMIVRVSEQSRDPQVKERNQQYPAFISDGKFKKMFGRQPKEYKADGVAYYISEPIHDVEGFFENDFAKVVELNFAVIDPNWNRSSDHGLFAEYLGKNFIVEHFKRFVTEVAITPSNEIVVRLFHLPQSSGTGKTRLCLELLFEMCSGFYCVYRPNLFSSGIPKTTPWMTLLVKTFEKSRSDDHSELICLAFIKHLLLTCPFRNKDGESKSGEEAKEIFTVDGVARRKFSEAFEKDFECEMRMIDTRLRGSVIEVESMMQTKRIFLVDEIVKILKKRKFDLHSFPIIFDSAQDLLISPPARPLLMTLYRALRRVLFMLKNTVIVGIFVGVKSSLADFTQNLFVDALLCERKLADNAWIAPPYLLTDTFDIHLKDEIDITFDDFTLVKAGNSGSVFYRSEALKTFAITSGRPFWKYYGNYDSAFAVASIKLNIDESLKDLTCFILRTGVSIHPQDALAHQLVQSGMATLLHVDAEGRHCLVYYFPEPLLSNAARIRMTDDTNYLNGLTEFIHRQEIGTFRDCDNTCDIVGRLMLLRGFDRTLLKPSTCVNLGTIQANTRFSVFEFGTSYIDRKPFVCPKFGITSTGEFLMSFTGLSKDDLKPMAIPDELWNGFVSMNQFNQLNAHNDDVCFDANGRIANSAKKSNVVVDQTFLLDGFARSSAIKFWHQAPGADAIIPVFRTDGKMGCIAVKFKFAMEFPSDESETRDQFSLSNMNFLNFGASGGFDAVDEAERNIIRIVIQFNRDHREHRPEDRVLIRDSVMWLNGLSAFNHLIEWPSGGRDQRTANITTGLHRILASERDYYEGFKFQKIDKFLMLRQTSKTGALTLRHSACPRLNNSYSALFDPKFKDSSVRKRLLEQFDSVRVK